MFTEQQIARRAGLIPETIFFQDEEGNVLPDYGELVLKHEERRWIAIECLQKKQSWETIILRAIKAGIRREKDHARD